MTKTLINTYRVTSQYKRHITYALMLGCFLMAGIYVFNVFKVISSTVALQKVQSQTVSMESDVQSLDAKYLALSSEITPDTLSKHGFTTGKVSAYIPRNASLGRVALGGHEL